MQISPEVPKKEVHLEGSLGNENCFFSSSLRRQDHQRESSKRGVEDRGSGGSEEVLTLRQLRGAPVKTFRGATVLDLRALPGEELGQPNVKKAEPHILLKGRNSDSVKRTVDIKKIHKSPCKSKDASWKKEE